MSCDVRQLHAHHPRRWRDFVYVYPVLSRRSKGLSLGVNLNPDKACNWDCVYCQVDRSTPGPRSRVDLDELRTELDALLALAASGEIWNDESFAAVPAPLRRINDIAFSGDGEPTACPVFEQACLLAAELKAAHRLPDVKIIVLTNMTLAHRPEVERGFQVLDRQGGEIWAKLEAGSDEHYRRVDRSAVPLARVLDNIAHAGRARPLVIQSMWMRCRDQPPTPAEFSAFLDRLSDLLAGGCRIKLVQLYTIARQTAEPFVTPLSTAELDTLAAQLHSRLPTLPIETYPGV
jgi:wyosine [tRNA(Phe)-imidazoG37] synthetase (radical SAM superfamily)